MNGIDKIRNTDFYADTIHVKSFLVLQYRANITTNTHFTIPKGTCSGIYPFTLYPTRHPVVDSTYAVNATICDTIQTGDTSLYGNRNIHCDVYYNPSGWNGYNYWMAYTPASGIVQENPYVVVSTDGNGLEEKLFIRYY